MRLLKREIVENEKHMGVGQHRLPEQSQEAFGGPCVEHLSEVYMLLCISEYLPTLVILFLHVQF